jgi:hypothetical protein
MPSRQRKATAGPAVAPQIQPRPADQFPPNPVPPSKVVPVEPVEKAYAVIGSQAVGDVLPGGVVRLTLTDGQEAALFEAGAIRLATEDDLKDKVPDKPEADQPMTGTEKEGD